MSHDHGGATVLDAAPDTLRFALVGSPNAGKTTLFNALTGLHAKTGNYPGVTVARRDGSTRVGQHQAIIEDLPGAYSLDPISPDERVVTAVLAGAEQGYRQPDGLLLVLDGTTLRRSLAMVSRVLHVDLPTAVVVTFSDELAARDGGLDIAALGDALGVPMIAVTAGATADLERLRALMADLPDWSKPIVMPPTDPMELASWSESVATAATYRSPQPDRRTVAIDRVLLHPVAGTLIFFGVMLAFFECIFTLAAPVQGWIESAFGWLGALVAEHVSNPWLSGLLGQAIIGGVGGVMVFLPQIVLLFFLISLLEACGYMARAAFLMDKVMAKAGLEGRAFVALLSSVACAVPGIMATRTLPSARDRLATMLAAPLMTCSARLPVYVLLIGMLVDRKATLGPLSVQAVVMFSLYLLGAVSAMIAAWVFSRVTGDKHANLPFYMEMPPYRWPRLKTILLAIWDATRTFLTKVGKIILLATVVLWTLLSLPGLAQSDTSARAQAAGVSESTYVVEHSYAASVGRAVEPLFEPLGFDWRINIGVLASLSAREVFVSTIGQVAAADDPEDPVAALRSLSRDTHGRAGAPLFDPPTLAALLVFFAYALQCTSTIAVMRRESGGWRWPLTAFVSYSALAWLGAWIAHTVVAAGWSG